MWGSTPTLAVLSALLIMSLAGASLPAEGPSAASAAACSSNGVLVRDVTIPDDTRMEPRSAYEKVWRLKHSGICDWSPAYPIALTQGSRVSASTSSLCWGPLRPGRWLTSGSIGPRAQPRNLQRRSGPHVAFGRLVWQVFLGSDRGGIWGAHQEDQGRSQLAGAAREPNANADAH